MNEFWLLGTKKPPTTPRSSTKALESYSTLLDKWKSTNSVPQTQRCDCMCFNCLKCIRDVSSVLQCIRILLAASRGGIAWNLKYFWLQRLQLTSFRVLHFVMSLLNDEKTWPILKSQIKASHLLRIHHMYRNLLHVEISCWANCLDYIFNQDLKKVLSLFQKFKHLIWKWILQFSSKNFKTSRVKRSRFTFSILTD